MNDSEATELSCRSHDNDNMVNVVHCKNEYALSNQKKLWQQVTSNIIN